MRGRYYTGDYDALDVIASSRNRVNKQERTPQAAFSSVSSRDDAAELVSRRTVTGEAIPAELQGFYNFFSHEVHLAEIWQFDPESYVYEALVVQTGSGQVSVCKGTRNQDQGISENHRVTSGISNILNPDAPLIGAHMIGVLGKASLTVGNFFFPGSSVHLSGDAFIELGGLPSLKTHMISGRGLAEATADLTLSTTATNITGASLGFFTARPNAVVEVTGIFDFECTGAGTTLLSGQLSVDGAAALAREAHFGVTAVGNRATVMQQWEVDIAVGADLVFHTFQLQAKKAAAVGTMVARQVHTTIKAKVLED